MARSTPEYTSLRSLSSHPPSALTSARPADKSSSIEKKSSVIKGEKPEQSTHTPRPISQLRDPSTFEPPPRRRTGGFADRPPPPSRSAASSSSAASRPPPPYREPSSTASEPPPPSLPPRLPARPQAASPQAASPDEPYINQSATSRLGARGISVPDLGISSRRSSSQEQGQEQGQEQNQGTSWAQKKSALQTINSFHRDPSSVSFQDARGAASTANNFRERHGAQVAKGAKAAGDLNQRYGISDRLGAAAGNGGGAGSGSGGTSGVGSAVPSLGSLAAKKKAPPPPPPKKASLSGAPAGSPGDGPPPLPMGTKPRFE